MWVYNDAVWGKLLGNYQPGELMKEWVNYIPMKRVSYERAKDAAFSISSAAGRTPVYSTNCSTA